jgi:hypothetical protein
MAYQLVLQARGDALEDHDLIVAVEDRLISAIGAVGDVDGHDVGSGETNIFILTDDPKAALALALPILDDFGLRGGVRAAYRTVGSAAYTMLWPPNSKEEFVVL